jgi:hypothetical protein
MHKLTPMDHDAAALTQEAATAEAIERKAAQMRTLEQALIDARSLHLEAKQDYVDRLDAWLDADNGRMRALGNKALELGALASKAEKDLAEFGAELTGTGPVADVLRARAEYLGWKAKEIVTVSDRETIVTWLRERGFDALIIETFDDAQVMPLLRATPPLYRPAGVSFVDGLTPIIRQKAVTDEAESRALSRAVETSTERISALLTELAESVAAEGNGK